MSYISNLEAAGWSYTGGCRCGGVLKHKYSRGKDRLLVYPERDRFVLRKFGAQSFGGDLNKLIEVCN
jgi:hypothetical protein